MTQAFNLALLANNVNSSGQLNADTGIYNTVNIANGGTNLSATPTNGQLLIGDGTGYTLATLTAGTGIGITNAAGSITVTNSLPGVATNFQQFTTVANNQTFTIPTGVSSIKVTICGGGGGGGAGAFNNCNTGRGGGGGYGAVSIKYITSLTSGLTLLVSVGAGGSAGTTGGGGNGGTSSVASGTQTITSVSATGGTGGAFGNGAQGAGGSSGSSSGQNFSTSSIYTSTYTGSMYGSPGSGGVNTTGGITAGTAGRQGWVLIEW